MKKMIFAAIAAGAVAFASCSKDAQNETYNPGAAGGPQVQITLGSDNQTRAFFDDTAAAEAWESEITSLTVYAFNNSGNLIVKRTLTTSEITARSARFSLPNSSAGTNCSFYAVANADYGDVATTAAMDALTESVTLDEYNGTASQTMDGRKRTAGFVMTGKATTLIAAAGNSTTVALTLKRTVAKIAVRAKLSDDFSVDYNGGKVVITSAEMARITPTSNSFYNTTYVDPAKTTLYSCEQTTRAANDNFDNLFYAYESYGYSPRNSGPYIKLKGYFDADGSDATTADRSEVNYTIFPNTVNGEIDRNAYYRIDATIKGLSGDGVIVNFTVAEWETPVTQTVDLGV